jgi:hypothetical protein
VADVDSDDNDNDDRYDAGQDDGIHGGV